MPTKTLEYDIESLSTNPIPVLDKCTKRQNCPRCNKSVKFFCYKCRENVCIEPKELPRVELPFHLYILKHERESDSKSTAIHSKIIAPGSVSICTHPSEQVSNLDASRTVLLYPGPSAVCIDQIDPNSFDQAIVIDGTWSQARSIIRHCDYINKFQKVTINPRITRFWRFQNTDQTHLATIEAIYFLYRDYFDAVARQDEKCTHTGSEVPQTKYDGRYDDLMFFYKYFYLDIQRYYNKNKEKVFNTRHRSGYIQYENKPEANISID